MAWRWFDEYYPPPSRARAVKGGIKAQSKRGTYGAGDLRPRCGGKNHSPVSRTADLRQQ